MCVVFDQSLRCTLMTWLEPVSCRAKVIAMCDGCYLFSMRWWYSNNFYETRDKQILPLEQQQSLSKTCFSTTKRQFVLCWLMYFYRDKNQWFKLDYCYYPLKRSQSALDKHSWGILNCYERSRLLVKQYDWSMVKFVVSRCLPTLAMNPALTNSFKSSIVLTMRFPFSYLWSLFVVVVVVVAVVAVKCATVRDNNFINILLCFLFFP